MLSWDFFILFTYTPNTSRSEYYGAGGGGGAGYLEVEESQVRSSRPYDREILCETTATGKVTVKQFIHTGGYSSLVQLELARQRYVRTTVLPTELCGRPQTEQPYYGLFRVNNDL